MSSPFVMDVGNLNFVMGEKKKKISIHETVSMHQWDRNVGSTTCLTDSTGAPVVRQHTDKAGQLLYRKRRWDG